MRCSSGKRTYATKAEAKRVCAKAAHNSGGKMRPYRCRECRGWHLTGQPKVTAKRSVLPPTGEQLRALRALGIEPVPGMTRSDAKLAIARLKDVRRSR